MLEKLKTKCNSQLSKINPLHRNALRYALIAYLFLRITTSVFIILGILLFPAEPLPENDPAKYQVTLNDQSPFEYYLLEPWYRWDTAFYLGIAEDGYEANLTSTVWPPLYPWLIALFSLVFKPPMLAALIVSNLAAIFAFYGFYLYVAEIWSEDTARKALFFLVLFPTSFYFVAGYTESIFLLFSISSMLFARKKNWILAGLTAALAVLTRNQGLLLAAPIAIEWWLSEKDRLHWRSFMQLALGVVPLILAFCGYATYVHWGLGADWPWRTLETAWKLHWGLPWEGLIGNIEIILGLRSDRLFLIPIHCADVLAFVITVFALINLRKKMPLPLQIYSWLMVILIFSKIDNINVLVSSSRYILAIFPIFVALAENIKQKYAKLSWFALSLVAQLFFVIVFYWRGWVA